MLILLLIWFLPLLFFFVFVFKLLSVFDGVLLLFSLLVSRLVSLLVSRLVSLLVFPLEAQVLITHIVAHLNFFLALLPDPFDPLALLPQSLPCFAFG